MPTAEARIETERPSRYLAQLCRHVDNIYRTDRHLQNRRHRHTAGGTQAHPQLPPHIEWSETHGTITVGDGTITMLANPGALTLRAEAADEETLRRIQDLITGLLGRFGRRDHLTGHLAAAGGARSPARRLDKRQRWTSSSPTSVQHRKPCTRLRRHGVTAPDSQLRAPARRRRSAGSGREPPRCHQVAPGRRAIPPRSQ
jgi:hypothetical protein